MFADDLAIQISGDLEKRFSLNIIEFEVRAKIALEQLGKFADNNILPVNINKTKAVLVHNVVAPLRPKIEYRGQPIEYVNSFIYLGVTISTKLGWGSFISDRVRKIRKIYRGMKILFHTIPKSNIRIRKRIFSAFSMPHFIWMFPLWFLFTEKQQRYIEHVYCSGLRYVFALAKWDNETTMILCRERTLRDHIYTYWCKFSIHLEKAPDALCLQQSWQAFKIVTSPDPHWYKNLGFNKRNRFLNRLRERAHHTMMEWRSFKDIQQEQVDFFLKNTWYTNFFVYKYYLSSTQI